MQYIYFNADGTAKKTPFIELILMNFFYGFYNSIGFLCLYFKDYECAFVFFITVPLVAMFFYTLEDLIDKRNQDKKLSKCNVFI